MFLWARAGGGEGVLRWERVWKHKFCHWNLL